MRRGWTQKIKRLLAVKPGANPTVPPHILGSEMGFHGIRGGDSNAYPNQLISTSREVVRQRREVTDAGRRGGRGGDEEEIKNIENLAAGP